MNPNKLFPLIVTRDLDKTRAFYVDTLGFEVSLQAPNYLQLRVGSDPTGPELSFMQRDDNCSEKVLDVDHGTFDGNGLIVSIPTDNADETHARYAKAEVEVTSEPTDRPWGWRSFAVRDPNGIYLDFFHVPSNGAADAAG